MKTHTPGEWRIVRSGIGEVQIVSGLEYVAYFGIATDRNNVDADAARIVACVNACAGIPSEDLGRVRDLPRKPA